MKLTIPCGTNAERMIGLIWLLPQMGPHLVAPNYLTRLFAGVTSFRTFSSAYQWEVHVRSLGRMVFSHLIPAEQRPSWVYFFDRPFGQDPRRVSIDFTWPPPSHLSFSFCFSMGDPWSMMLEVRQEGQPQDAWRLLLQLSQHSLLEGLPALSLDDVAMHPGTAVAILALRIQGDDYSAGILWDQAQEA